MIKYEEKVNSVVYLYIDLFNQNISCKHFIKK